MRRGLLLGLACLAGSLTLAAQGDKPGAAVPSAFRSYVVADMRRNRLLLVGDSAHIVPPVGAKGMNLAIVDACVLFDAVRRFLSAGDETGLDAYSSTCLERVWRVQDFSMWMAWMLHTLPEAHPDRSYSLARSHAQLRYLEQSRAYQTQFAENYVGFPMPVTV